MNNKRSPRGQNGQVGDLLRRHFINFTTTRIAPSAIDPSYRRFRHRSFAATVSPFCRSVWSGNSVHGITRGLSLRRSITAIPCVR